jgi:hypothetical protein
MPKINKVYPPFFNGVSQQSPELILDNQCKEMVNCVPDLVEGLTKRPPAKFVAVRDYATYPSMENAVVFHTYDRGEDEEEYIFVENDDASNPILVFDQEGNAMTVTYEASVETEIKNYLAEGSLKGLTVQDRTWIFSKNAEVDLDYSATTPLSSNYNRTAYYWIKRGSGDRFNPFNYAVYLNGTTYACNPNKPEVGGTDAQDPPTGFEDSDYAASYLQSIINGSAGFSCSVIGSILKIWRSDGADFTFSSWDSWGNQASEGWKGSVNKITDLPKDMVFDDVYVEIKGTDTSDFTDYYVKWNGSSWEECLDPAADRGQLTNMPIKCDRIALSGGVATFKLDVIDWSLPRVGSLENNPNPSFAPDEDGNKRKITDLFFYKNRLGIASEDSVTMSETGNYTNFYATTALDLLDTDVIDITVATEQASQIYYAKPFNNSLYIFTKYAQYELVAEGGFTPSTVALNNTTNYPMAVDVEPIVINDSLYFISTTDNRQQLREYIKGDNLSVKGIDLNVSTPTYLDKPIKKLVADGLLGYVLCCTADNTVYLYNYKEDGTNRIQSAWSTWTLLNNLAYVEGSYEYYKIESNLLVITKTENDYRYHRLQLDYNVEDDNIDTSSDGTTTTEYSYESKIILPDYYPKLSNIRTPMNKMLIKKITIEGEGQFDAEVYRKDYDHTFTKTYTYGLKDLDLHVASKVGKAIITIKDSSANDFKITSVVVEGLFSTTSKEMN